MLLSCVDKNWISVDVRIRPVFPDSVTNYLAPLHNNMTDDYVAHKILVTS